MRHAISLVLSSLLLVSLGACAEDDQPCTSDSCRGPLQGPDQSDGPTDLPEQLCRAACSVLMRECGPVSPSDEPGDNGEGDCTDWCRHGGLTEAEASCVADTGCADLGE